MAKQYEGPVFKTPKGRAIVKSATGITHVADYGMEASRPLSHGDSPLTMQTDDFNWGVTNGDPRPPTPPASPFQGKK